MKTEHFDLVMKKINNIKDSLDGHIMSVEQYNKLVNFLTKDMNKVLEDTRIETLRSYAKYRL